MNLIQVAFNDMLQTLDDAILLAKSAYESATRENKPKVEIVKVANDRCEQLAELMVKSGAFVGTSKEELKEQLSKADANQLTDIMVKLATIPRSENFVESIDEFNDLVEKPANTDSSGDPWFDACREEGLI